MIEKIITQNSEQVLKIKWDGERFALIELDRGKIKIVILNPPEAMKVVKFLAACGKEK